MPLPPINPPLVNSANPWATNTPDLQALFDCRSTGAITTRTSLIAGFDHDENVHQYLFFDPASHSSVVPRPQSSISPPITTGETTTDPNEKKDFSEYGGSLNTLGYSPISLATYLSMIEEVIANSTLPEPVKSSKPIIVSITGDLLSIRPCYRLITTLQSRIANPLCMEINLSCPNIPNSPPPAYDGDVLVEYLFSLADELASVETKALVRETGRRVRVGVKIPPYTYHDQFKTLIEKIKEAGEIQQDVPCPVDFITATNTLGASLVVESAGVESQGGVKPVLESTSGLGIGGMAGAPIHPLALGNVRMLRMLLDKEERLKGVDVIGVGGVEDAAGFKRMRSVGAKVVGVGTALGRFGVGVFEKILDGA